MRGFTIKNSYFKKPKEKTSTFYSKQPELSEKAWKKKKKKWQKNRQEKKDENSVPATEINATNTFSGKKRRKNKDLSQIVYYTYKKNGYYFNKYLKCNLKNLCQSWQLPRW